MPFVTADQLRPGAEVRLDASTTAIVTNVDEHFPACTRCGAINVEDDGDHADSTGHWPTSLDNTDRAGLAVDVLTVHTARRRQLILDDADQVLQTKGVGHWCAWAGRRLDQLLALIPDDHALYDLVSDEIEGRAHEADVRRMNGGVLP